MALLSPLTPETSATHNCHNHIFGHSVFIMFVVFCGIGIHVWYSQSIRITKPQFIGGFTGFGLISAFQFACFSPMFSNPRHRKTVVCVLFEKGRRSKLAAPRLVASLPAASKHFAERGLGTESVQRSAAGSSKRGGPGTTVAAAAKAPHVACIMSYALGCQFPSPSQMSLPPQDPKRRTGA